MPIKSFYHHDTHSWTHLVWNETSLDAAVIDPVLDYDPASSSCDTVFIDHIISFIKSNTLKLRLIIETHAHADHITASQRLIEVFPDAKTAIGAEITKVQSTFKRIYNLCESFSVDGSQFDILVQHGETIRAGQLEFKGIHTPGHTEACYTFIIENSAFVGDTLFMPDFGVARCDFPHGNAGQLFDSVTERLYTLPDATMLYTAHDYQPGGRQEKCATTIKESRSSNIHINDKVKCEDFIKMRTERDLTLPPPRLLYPSIQVNINGGKLPEAESNGEHYLKIPITQMVG